jgi:hypothetical protein
MIESPEDKPTAQELAIYDHFQREWPDADVILGWSHVYDNVRDITVYHKGMRGPAHCEVCCDWLELSGYVGNNCPTMTSVPLDAPLAEVIELLRPFVDDWVPEDDRWENECEEDDDD